jgi:hypothetical protein
MFAPSTAVYAHGPGLSYSNYTTQIFLLNLVGKITTVGHVAYIFINMLFISMGFFYDNLHPQIVSVGTTANSP